MGPKISSSITRMPLAVSNTSTGAIWRLARSAGDAACALGVDHLQRRALGLRLGQQGLHAREVAVVHDRLA